ncbi:MAG: GFA family protein, partial [Pseudolabrys sp.]
MPKFSGGCLCGAVRYECNAEPLGMAICHCTHCQKVSGSAFSVNIVVPAPSVTWQGQSASYADTGESGKPLSRKFCRNCGSSLATETEALPGASIIKAGTLDDKSWLKPNYHIWTRSA